MEHSFITHYIHIMRLGYKFRECPVPGVSPHCSNDSPIHVYLVILSPLYIGNLGPQIIARCRRQTILIRATPSAVHMQVLSVRAQSYFLCKGLRPFHTDVFYM